MNAMELDQLFASCMPQLRRTAIRVLRNPQDSEDAVQEGLLLALRNLGQFEGRSSFSTWLHTIVKNAALTHARRMNCRPKCSLEEEVPEGIEPAGGQHFVDPGLSPEEECLRLERARILREVVKELPSRYAFAMRLCYFDGIDLKNAAQKIGVTVCALKTHLFRARRLAARRMREKCSRAYKRSLDSQRLRPQREPESDLPGESCSVRDFAHLRRERNSLHSRPCNKLDFAGDNREANEKKPRFWKHSRAAHVRTIVQGARRPAC